MYKPWSLLITNKLSGVISARATSIPAIAVTETHIFCPFWIRITKVTSLLLPLIFNLVRALPEKVVKFVCPDLIAFNLLIAGLVFSVGFGLVASCFFALQ